MLRLLIAFLLLETAATAAVSAQEQTYLRGGDTLHYTYTPIVPDEARPELQERPQKRSFLRRVVDYFGESSEDKTFEKRIDFTFAGGPSYSPTTSLGIGVLAAGLFRIDRTDSVTPPSDISIFASASLSGFYSVGMTGNTIFRHSRSKLDYLLSFSSMPRDIWGRGYDAGAYNPRSSYVEKCYKIQTRYLHRIFSNAYFGGVLNFQHTAGVDFKNEAYLYGERRRYTAVGIGAIAEYDSRDFIPNPSRGVYISLQELMFPKGLNDCGATLWRTNVTADFYRQVWRGCVAAFDLYGEFNTDDTPWPLLARMGGSARMRGYYEGRYTDCNLVTVQVELRQHLWRRIGCVVWGGAGNVFSDFGKFHWSQTLPNYGLGLRWELKKRVNIRFDYGFGRKTGGLLFNINEAF